MIETQPSAATASRRTSSNQPRSSPATPTTSHPADAPTSEPIGTFCLVLHSHLPWLAHHGSWPVGEEWLYQSLAASYLPVMDVLARLAAEGRRDLLTLGVTPVLAAQLDDPHCLTAFGTWLGFWQARAAELAQHGDPMLSRAGSYEWQGADAATAAYEARWRHGASPVLRPLVDAGAIEYLGGPATHAFTPLLDDEVASFALDTGLADARVRLGQRPHGIWAPECGYRPGLERIYQANGVSHFMADGPTLLHVGASPADAWTVGESDVVVFGRDLDVSYRVWSPRRGYPGGAWYRDFHAFHHESGFRPYRVTSPRLPSEEKAPYDPAAALAAASRDADDFIDVVARRLVALRDEREGRPGLVVAAYDTELFGHWWHEGPVWLEHVLRRLPEAGVRVTTLRGAINAGAVAGAVELQNGSWGSGKDFGVWSGPQVADIVSDNDELQRRLRKLVTLLRNDRFGRRATRAPALDQAAREALLALSSDWAFMVSKDSAAAYARDRHRGHHEAFHRLATLLERSVDSAIAVPSAVAASGNLARDLARTDYPFGHLDARALPDVC